MFTTLFIIKFIVNTLTMLNNKRVLFIGPLGNPDKKFVDEYDIVVRTNGFFSIDKKILKSDRCDILIVNQLYSKLYGKTVNDNMDKVKYVLAKHREAYNHLIKHIDDKHKHRVLYMSYSLKNSLYVSIKKQPLIVTNFLLYVKQYFTPKTLFFTGFDFYVTQDVNKFWLKGYAPKESKIYNVLSYDKNTHDVRSNVKFFKQCLEKISWVKCDDNIKQIVDNYP